MAIWDEPQPGESSKAWAAFTHYRDLGSGRTVNLAWRRSTGRSKGAAHSRWELWCSTNRWVERCKAYDAHLDALIRQVREKRFIELLNRQAEHEFSVQDQLEALERRLCLAVEKHDNAPVVDIERSEEKEVTVSDSGEIKIITVKTRITGMKVGSLARLSDSYRRCMQQAVVGVWGKPADTKRVGALGTPKTPLPEFMRIGLEQARASRAEKDLNVKE